MRNATRTRACTFLITHAAACGSAIFLFSAPLGAFTTVKISTSAPLGIEADFIQQTTTHFNVLYTKNPLAANTFTITIFGPGEPAEVLGSSFDDCIVHGFADGMDSERLDDLRTISSMRSVELSSATCAGILVDSPTVDACQRVYDTIISTITLRDGTIFSSTGAVIF